jgi:uncharacterized protein (TIGR00255 family)
MISMTGYAYREKSSLSEPRQDMSVSVEIKGVNSRFLEIYINLPPWLSTLEVKIREQISAAFGRGKVEVFIRIREHNTPVSIRVNTAAAKAYYDAINKLSKDLSINTECSLDTLLRMENVLEIEKNRDDERYWKEIEPLFLDAVKAFGGEREREGRHTEEDIMGNLKIIESSVKTVASFAPVIENNLKDNIRSRFAELLGNQVDENRILAETAALLLKYTVAEEVSRLSSHLEEFRAEAARNKRPGKKLDFLCQEINREINTIGSKSAIIEVSSEVVKMKEALENIREQLRNIE